MPRRRKIFADILGRPNEVAWFLQGPSRSRHFTAFHLTEFPADEAEVLSRSATSIGGTSSRHENAPEDLATWLERHPQVGVELSRLSPKQRQAIDEVLFRGRTITDLANEFGTSLDAIRQRIVGTQRPGGRVHGGLKNKCPILYALWLFRHRERHDIAEVHNAFLRAVDSLHTQPPDQPA